MSSSSSSSSDSSHGVNTLPIYYCTAAEGCSEQFVFSQDWMTHEMSHNTDFDLYYCVRYPCVNIFRLRSDFRTHLETQHKWHEKIVGSGVTMDTEMDWHWQGPAHARYFWCGYCSKPIDANTLSGKPESTGNWYIDRFRHINCHYTGADLNLKLIRESDAWIYIEGLDRASRGVDYTPDPMTPLLTSAGDTSESSLD